MYAPVQTAAARRNRGAALAAGGPILAICCLGFILFLIAATIVLALIPVYLSTRNASTSSSSPRYYAVMNPQTSSSKRALSSGPLSEGILDSQSLLNINSAMETALKLQSGSFVSESGTVATPSGKRKREESEVLRESRASNNPQLYCAFHFNKNKCDRCGNMGYLQSIQSFPVTANISINGVKQGPITFIVTLLLTSSSNNIPSTSTVASTTAGSSSSTPKSYTVSLSVPDSVPVGNVDSGSLPTLGSAVATNFNVASGAVAVDSAKVTSSKKRKRRGFGLMRERRATKHLFVIFHFLLSLCPTCDDPAFITKIESLTISISVTISIGGVSVPQFSATGSVAPSSTVSIPTTVIAGAGKTSTIAGATAKVVG